MAEFYGIAFVNPGFICYANAGINCLLASKHVCSNIHLTDCVGCELLHEKRNNPYGLQSSMDLKNWLAERHQHFGTNNQQDATEFVQCCVQDCPILAETTHSQLYSTQQCGKCKQTFDVSDEYTDKHVIDRKITDDNLAGIMSKSDFIWKKCSKCKQTCYHEEKQTLLIPPSVLIISLANARFGFENNGIKDDRLVQASPFLSIDGFQFVLKSVISHHGDDAHSGHYTAAVSTSQGWVYTDDENLYGPFPAAPSDGCLFIYDKLPNQMLGPQSLSENVQDQQGSSTSFSRQTEIPCPKRKLSGDSNSSSQQGRLDLIY